MNAKRGFNLGSIKVDCNTRNQTDACLAFSPKIPDFLFQTMSTDKKMTTEESPERLAIHLGRLGPKRRVLLVSGPKNDREIKKFLRGIKVPREMLCDIADGSMIGYTNLELITPNNQSFFVIEALGSADAQWKVLAAAAVSMGYTIADVKDLHVVRQGFESEPIPVAACRGMLHNVYASTR